VQNYNDVVKSFEFKESECASVCAYIFFWLFYSQVGLVADPREFLAS